MARFVVIHCLSGDIYITEKGKLHDDLCDLGQTSCPNRVARLARSAGIRAQIGYKRRPDKYGGKPLSGNRWAMQSRQPTDLVLQALLMAVWHRKPADKVLVHSPSRALLHNTLPGSGSGKSVYQSGMVIISKASQSRTQYELARELP